MLKTNRRNFCLIWKETLAFDRLYIRSLICLDPWRADLNLISFSSFTKVGPLALYFLVATKKMEKKKPWVQFSKAPK